MPADGAALVAAITGSDAYAVSAVAEPLLNVHVEHAEHIKICISYMFYLFYMDKKSLPWVCYCLSCFQPSEDSAVNHADAPVGICQPQCLDVHQFFGRGNRLAPANKRQSTPSYARRQTRVRPLGAGRPR